LSAVAEIVINSASAGVLLVMWLENRLCSQRDDEEEGLN
jgi:hypothetical protein